MQDNNTFGKMNLMTKRTKLHQKRSSNGTLWTPSRPSGAGLTAPADVSDLQFVCFCLKHLGCQITPSAFQAVLTCLNVLKTLKHSPERRPYEPTHTQNKTRLRVGKTEIKGELYLHRFPGSLHKVFPFLEFALTESELSRIRFHNIWAG